MGVLKRYCASLAKKWVLLAITLIDIVVFFITLWYPVSMPAKYTRYLTMAIAVAAYFLANVSIFAELEPKADIELVLRAEPRKLYYLQAAQSKDHSDEHPHLGKNGLPQFATLELRFDAVNHGDEKGEVVCDLDIENSVFPPLITLDYQTRINLRHTWEIGGGEKRFVGICLGFVITEPWREYDFIRALKAANQEGYSIVFHYYVRHSKGYTRPRTICIEGTLEFFCKALLYDWKQYGFDHYVQYYEFAE